MAGLLDSLFGSGSDANKGLLDFLRGNAMNQQMPSGLPSDTAQYGPSAGAQPPVFAPQAAPSVTPQFNPQPSPMDNAQWPTGPVGAPSQANAQIQPPVPQQPPAVIPAQPAQPAPAPEHRISDALASISHGGSLLGAVRGQYDDPRAQAAQVASMTEKALIAKGVDPSVARAAVQPGNGEALKELFKTALTGGTHSQETDKDGNVWDINKQTGQRTIALAARDDKFQHYVVKNPDGSETERSFNTKTGETTGAPPPPQGRYAVDPELTGPARLDALKKVDPDYARRIESMVNGDIPLPTGVAALKPNADRMIKDVLAVDGAVSASDFATRAATRRDYASGMASRVTKSLNTTIEHAANLDGAIDKLKNYSYFPSLANYVHDKVANNTDPEYQKARSQFESAKEAFVKELDFTLSGGHSSVSGSAQLRDNIRRADSPEALHAAVQEDLHLLSARLNSHAKGFAEGTKSQRDGQDFLYPKNKATFNRLMGSQDTSTGQPVPGVSAEPAPAAAPALQPGQSTNIGGISIKRVN
jgi:hypothetical protein